MHLIQSLALVSLAVVVASARDETMEEFYCLPYPESYPRMRNNMEILSSDPPLNMCAPDCSVTKTEEVWTKFEVMEGGERTTKKAYAINILSCQYDGWTGKLGP